VGESFCGDTLPTFSTILFLPKSFRNSRFSGIVYVLTKKDLGGQDDFGRFRKIFCTYPRVTPALPPVPSLRVQMCALREVTFTTLIVLVKVDDVPPRYCEDLSQFL
jgi:hypothetical protein